MPARRRLADHVALLLASLALAACGGGDDDTRAGATSDADGATTSTSAAAAVARKGKGAFVVGDRTYAFESKRCIAVAGDGVGTVLADGTGTFDGRPFTVVVRSAPSETSAIETVQVVFGANEATVGTKAMTEAIVGTNYVRLPSGAADTKLKVEEDGKATGTIAVSGSGGQPSGEGTLTLECEAA